MTVPADKIAALGTRTDKELREVWGKLSDQQLPTLPARLMRQLIAHRLQERLYGGVPKLIKRELLRRASQNGEQQAIHKTSANLSPGAMLVREWNGQTVVVDVLEDGFRYDDKLWRSLSEIARHVTGTHWSGPRFFGLTRHG